MSKKIELEKEIWEGWKVKDFIEELQPSLDMIMKGRKPLESRLELVKWLKDNQPYYKKTIVDVVEYFSRRYCL